MRVLDLFSGIGGFSLGLERAGMTTEAFCEIDPFCRRVLTKHWGAIGYMAADVTDANFDALNYGRKIDVITAGFPCQDISRAGKRTGHNGTRTGLWSHVIRAVRETRPRYVILENSPAILDIGLGDILGALASLGYDAVWHCIPASAVGARHARNRTWIVGYLPNAESRGFEQRWREQCAKISDKEWGLCDKFFEPSPSRVADGVPYRLDRNKAIGNAVVPQIPEIIGRAIMSKL